MPTGPPPAAPSISPRSEAGYSALDDDDDEEEDESSTSCLANYGACHMIPEMKQINSNQAMSKLLMGVAACLSSGSSSESFG